MKGLSLIMILTVLIRLNATCQTEPTVKIDRSVGIKIIKQLESCDSLKQVHLILEQQFDESSRLIQVKEMQLLSAQESVGRLKTIIDNYAVLDKEKDIRQKDLEKKYKKSVQVGRFKVVVIGIVGLFAAFGILK